MMFSWRVDACRSKHALLITAFRKLYPNYQALQVITRHFSGQVGKEIRMTIQNIFFIRC